jgi:transposase
VQLYYKLGIIYLPPYSPELNPIERLWLNLKHPTIKNKIFDTFEALEDCIGDCITNLTSDYVASICKNN